MRKLLIGTATAAVVAVALPALLAAQDPSAIIKDRQEAMKHFGGHMKAINEFVEAGIGSGEDVAARALEIQESAGKIPSLFPAGTSLDDGIGRTGAKPIIWSDRAGFEAAAAKLGIEAGKLAEIAAGGDRNAIGVQFAALGKNGCGGCHSTFRKKLD